MKKILLLVGILLSSGVQAEDYYLPDGCYVSFQAPNVCYDIPIGSSLIWDLNDQAALIQSYGPAVAIILGKFNKVTADYEDAAQQWDLWYQKSTKQAKQIKRLKAQIAALK